MPRKPNYGYIEQQEKTEGGWIITQYDPELYFKLYTPKERDDKLEYKRQHPIRWKLMRWFRASGFY